MNTMNTPTICEMQLEKDKSDVLSSGMLGVTQNFSMETVARLLALALFGD